MKNFIPFGRIAIVKMYDRLGTAVDTVPRASRFTPRLAFSQLMDMSTGTSAIAHLQQFTAVMLPPFGVLGGPLKHEIMQWLTPAQNNVSMRIGHSGRGMLTHNYGNLWGSYDSHFSAAPCWNLAHPYRIYPGQEIFAQKTFGRPQPGSTAHNEQKWPEWIALHSRRIDTDEPYMLYNGTMQETGGQFATGASPDGLLRYGNTLRCPDSGPLDIEKITAHRYRAPYALNADIAALTVAEQQAAPHHMWNMTGLQLFGPDRQPWWNNPELPASALNAQFVIGATEFQWNLGSWVLNPPTPWIELGEEWALTTSETFTAEFECDRDVLSARDDASGVIVVVLRGSLEVEDGR